MSTARDPLYRRHRFPPEVIKWDEPMAALTGLRNRIAVCGVATECWVLSTILGAVDHGRFVRLVSDACARLSPRRRTGARNPRADGPRGEHGLGPVWLKG